VLALLQGCSGNGNVQNQPPPNNTPVSIGFDPSPVESISLGSTASVTAVVDNDPASLGVDWNLVCGSGSSCGTLAPLHTASGSAALYTPPANITGNSETVTIVAYATADHSQNVLTPLTVTGFGSTLQGTFVFAVQGTDPNGMFQLAGVVSLD